MTLKLACFFITFVSESLIIGMDFQTNQFLQEQLRILNTCQKKQNTEERQGIIRRPKGFLSLFNSMVT